MLKAYLWHQVGLGVVSSHKGKAFVLEIRHVEGEASASIGHGSERVIISGSWDLQIGTLRADDSHRVKPRCVPGDFLSWFVPTKVFHSCPHQWSLSEKLQIQHWRRCAVRLNTSQLSCQLGSWSKMQSNISRSHPVCSISVDLSQLTKLRAYGIQKELQFSKKSLESWMCYGEELHHYMSQNDAGFWLLWFDSSGWCYAIPSTSSSFPHIRFWRWPSAKSNKSKMSGISE